MSVRRSEGGRGGPGLAQPARSDARVVMTMGAMSLGVRDFVRTWGEAGIGRLVFSLASGAAFESPFRSPL